jgi:RNA polymerase-binding transcription factor DksA
MKRLQGRLARLREEGSRLGGGEANEASVAPPLDFADQGSHEFEEAVTLGLADNEQHLMEEIDAALARIEDGVFGRCLHCCGAISKERLQALPYCGFCAQCMKKVKSLK